ncbi:hypothetical protein A9495_06275 [Brachyspira hampsonii]|nr:hypothetical protein A9495_06275 [Brachyspira hampsonii]
MDVTEIEVERPKNNQKEYYSGKKKCHTMKVQVIIDALNKKIINFSLAKGSEHDFSIYKNNIELIDTNSILIVDKGYTGIQKYHDKVLIPKRNYKKKSLTKNELLMNQFINKIRVRIEHVFGILKRYKILSTCYRNHLQRLDLRFCILSFVYNFQL